MQKAHCWSFGRPFWPLLLERLLKVEGLVVAAPSDVPIKELAKHIEMAQEH